MEIPSLSFLPYKELCILMNNKTWNVLLIVAIGMMLLSGIGVYVIDQQLLPFPSEQKDIFTIFLAVLFGIGLLYLVLYRARMATENKLTLKTLLYLLVFLLIISIFLYR